MAFEINAMDESMRRSRNSATSRAFQRVPFTMRRRTAAHNYKRVPKRLHNRAKREMAEDNTPTVNSRTRKPKTSRARFRAETARKLGILAKRQRLLKANKVSGTDSQSTAIRAARPKIRRNELNDLPVTAPRYRKRQRNKTWLPTHMWHAKRARMPLPAKPLWGFSIPLTPTQKNYRPTHRAQWQKGAIAWDMSYMSTIGLFGKENIIQSMLKDVGLTQQSLWNGRGIRWRSGAIHWTGNLSKNLKDTIHIIGPVTIIWNPSTAPANPGDDTNSRQLFLRIHPSIFSQTFNELLRLIKAYKPRPYIQDLRHEIGSIDITGPDAMEALQGVLKPFQSEPNKAHVSKFESLSGLGDPASLSLGALLAFSIADPRLKYPPQTVYPPDPTSQQVQLRILEAITAFSKDEALEPYELFDRDSRFKASQLPSQRSINRRRGNTGPGIALEPSSVDPSIPVILLGCRNSTEAPIPGTWTVMLPWKCVQPVWYALMHYPLSTGGNPAFGGLDEIRQLSFERGQAWFPGDMPGTDAGNAWETRERQARWKVWDRKPKGKRVQGESLDLGAGRKGEIGVGWSCDFETLFSLQNSAEAGPEPAPADNSEGDHEMSGVSEAVNSPGEKPNTKSTFEAAVKPLTNITYIPKHIFTNLTTAKPPGVLPPNSTITVHIKLVSRGVVSACARIYRLPEESSAPASSSSTQPEVPATQQPPTSALENKLPPDLYAQWLAQQPAKHGPNFNSNSSRRSKGQNNKRNHQGKGKNNKDIAPPSQSTRLGTLARALTGPVGTHLLGGPNSNTANANGHPLCPDAADLLGYVTTGSFNLRAGRGEAIASLSAVRAAEELRRYRLREGGGSRARLCVVRDAGQMVGWLARWEII
ncbi:POPLD domain-containing protein [Nemania sp. FL0916]|nr:POPLD domain-containing protein [Nemania sp. FL0916]